jgi:hypothetical protein
MSILRNSASSFEASNFSRMLQEFYQQAKLDGKSCHATYILCGMIEEPIPSTSGDAMQIDEDDFPMSSPFVATQESSKSRTSTSKVVRTIVLADEDNVIGTKPSMQS